jgi:hypothetical protein
MDKPAGKLLRGTPPEKWNASPDAACTQFARFAGFAPRPPLRWYARWPAFLTTPFKMLGIRGWTRLPAEAAVVGTVVQSAGSTDGFLTIDVRLDSVQLGGSPCDWSRAANLEELCPIVPHGDAWRNLDRYLRIEAHGHAHGPYASGIIPGRKVSTSGSLRVDHDPPNFLELHVLSETPIESPQAY